MSAGLLSDVTRWMFTSPVAWMSWTKRYLNAMCLDLLLRPSLLLRLSADVLSAKMSIGDFAVVNDGAVVEEVMLY